MNNQMSQNHYQPSLRFWTLILTLFFWLWTVNFSVSYFFLQ